jgi:hypothetical protein
MVYESGKIFWVRDGVAKNVSSVPLDLVMMTIKINGGIVVVARNEQEALVKAA